MADYTQQTKDEKTTGAESTNQQESQNTEQNAASGESATVSAQTNASSGENGWNMDPEKAAETTQRFVDDATLDPASIDRLEHVDIENERQLLEQQAEAQRKQVEQQVDFGVQQGVTELERNLEDSKEKFQTQRNQVAADEMRALDNQALYAEARGDRGGLGQAQYASIQNTAAINRRNVNREQTKLSTDTARQIADLRAQGEFQKADKLLEVTQSYLSQLLQLEQWAKEMNMSVDQFNAQLAEWEAQYQLSLREFLTNTELSAAQLTGAFADGTLTFEAQSRLRQELAAAGQTMIELGLTPTAQQLAAMGWTQAQYAAYLQKLQAAAASYDDYGGSGGKSSSSKTPSRGEQEREARQKWVAGEITQKEYQDTVSKLR